MKSVDGIEFMEWVSALIDLRIEEAFGRDASAESVEEQRLRGRIRNSLGLHQHEDESGPWEAIGG